MQLFGFLKSIFTDEVSQNQPKKEKWVVSCVDNSPGSTLNAFKESDLEGMKERQSIISEQYKRAQAYRQQQKVQTTEKDIKSDRSTPEHKKTPFQ